MGLRLSPGNQECCFFVTCSYKEWKHFGKVEGFNQQLAKSLIYCCTKYNAKLIAYVFMPSHIHLVLYISGKSLSNFMRDFKKYIAQKGTQELEIAESQIWEPRFHRITLFSDAVMRTKITYIHNNPIRAGLVDDAIKWQWSSAADYFTESDGHIPIWKGWTG